MHWLLLLAVLSSTSGLKNGGNPAQLNRLAENALRQQIGTVNNVKVNITPGASGGSFDAMTVNLDGFSADQLMELANRTAAGQSNGDLYPQELNTKGLDGEDLSSILNGNLGDILGGFFTSRNGRIGRLSLNATNFSFGGARYDSMRADLGEIRFDWAKALQGNPDIKSIQPGRMFVQLRGDQAAKLLAPRLPSVRDVTVRFSNGKAFLGGRASSYGLNVPFEVGAQLGVRQNQVLANNFEASIARLRLPGFILDQLTKSVNPLYDFDPQKRWPLAVNLQTAGTANNALSMKGGIQWLGFSRGASHDNSQRHPQDTRPRSKERPKTDILGDILNGTFERE